MFFRFTSTIAVLTVVSLCAIALEKHNLALKREISQQHYELHALQVQRSKQILEMQRWGAVPRLLEEWERTNASGASWPSTAEMAAPETGRQDSQSKTETLPPLLEWRLQQ